MLCVRVEAATTASMDVTAAPAALAELRSAVEVLVAQAVQLRDRFGWEPSELSPGGGLGVPYTTDMPATDIAAYGETLSAALQTSCAAHGLPLPHLTIEPGRSIVANAGLLLTRVEYLKDSGDKHFAIVDAAMNDLVRPALYEAWMAIAPVAPRADAPEHRYDVVGPVCETGDFLGRDRPLRVAAGDLLCVQGAGAYGFTMSSNYNSRPRAAEVMVAGEQFHVVRARETFADLIRGEALLPQD